MNCSTAQGCQDWSSSDKHHPIDMDRLDRYISEHSTPQGEALAWIECQTNIRTNHARMLSGAVQGRFLTMLVEMIRPASILEIGTFTGYSAVCLASGLGEGGHLDTLEINDELEDLILEGFSRAGLSDKISLHVGDATIMIGIDDQCRKYALRDILINAVVNIFTICLNIAV